MTDLPALEELWRQPPWTAKAKELCLISAEAANAGREHLGLGIVSDDGSLTAAALYRVVAGAVGTGEIEAVVPASGNAAQELLAAAVADLEVRGMRLVIAEYPDADEWREYGALLALAGFQIKARISDYFADGVALVIATTR